MNTNSYEASLYQHTLKNSFTCVSSGLHTGEKIAMCVTPADVNTGIIFIRHDIESPHSTIQANWRNVTETRLSTTIANSNGVRVSTIEHLMAALYANGIDNARVILDGPEVPIMDGSAAPFVALLNHAGKVKQNSERRALVIKQAISISNGDKFVGLTPSPTPWIEIEINFKNSAIGQQNFSSALDQDIFNNEFAAARTFGFKEQVDTLHKVGLAQGSSLENTVVIDGHKIINKEALRFKNEFVRHKILDSIGDLALTGARVIGQFTGICNGHQINNALIQKLMANEHNWQYTTVRKANKYWEKQLQQTYQNEYSVSTTKANCH